MERQFKTARQIARVFLIAELSYILLSFLFLNCGILPRWINGKESESLQIHYAFAYSLYPGTVRADGVTIRVSDANVQLYFELAGVGASFDLAALTRQEVSINRVRVEGLRFWLRVRRWPRQWDPRMAALLAPIPGLLPFKEPPRAEEPSSAPWRIRLRQVEINDVRELWVEEYRFLGHGSVHGDFFLHPGRTARISKAVLDISSGSLRMGKEPVATQVRAHIDAWISPFDNRKLKRSQFFRYLSGDVEGTAHIVGVEFLNHYLHEARSIRLNGGHGPLAVNLALRRGELITPSFLKVEAEDLQASLWDQRARGNGFIDWHIQTLGEKSRLGRLTVTLPNYEVYRRQNPSAQLRGRNLTLLAVSPDLSLEVPFRRLSVEIRSGVARIADLRYLQSYLPSATRVRLYGGEGTVSASVFADSRRKGKDTGVLHLRTRSAHVQVGATNLQGDIAMDAYLHAGDLRAGKLDISGTQIYLRRIQAATQIQQRTEDFRNWWADVNLHSGQLQVAKETSFDGTIGVSARDARPILALASGDRVPGFLMGILSCDHLKASLDLRVNGQHLSISDASIRGGNTSIYGWISMTPQKRLGKILVWYGPIAAGLQIAGKGVTLILNDANGWFYRSLPAE